MGLKAEEKLFLVNEIEVINVFLLNESLASCSINAKGGSMAKDKNKRPKDNGGIWNLKMFPVVRIGKKDYYMYMQKREFRNILDESDSITFDEFLDKLIRKIDLSYPGLENGRASYLEVKLDRGYLADGKALGIFLYRPKGKPDNP